MRLTDIVLASVVLGAALGLWASGQPSAASVPGIASDGGRPFCERIARLGAASPAAR